MFLFNFGLAGFFMCLLSGEASLLSTFSGLANTPLPAPSSECRGDCSVPAFFTGSAARTDIACTARAPTSSRCSRRSGGVGASAVEATSSTPNLRVVGREGDELRAGVTPPEAIVATACRGLPVSASALRNVGEATSAGMESLTGEK